MPVPSKFASAGEKVYDKPELLDLIIDFLLPTKNKCESLNEGRGKDRSALQSSGQQGLEAASRSIYKETDYCMAVHILSKRVHGDLYLSCIRHITYQRECDIGLNSCGPYFIHAHERLTPADIRHVAPLCPNIIDLKDTHELRVGPCRGDCCDPVDEIIQHTFTGSSRTSHRRVMYPVKLDLAQLTPSVFEYPFWEYLNDINNSWADQITEFVIDLRIMAAPKDNTPVEPMLQLLRENMDDRVVVLDYGRQGVKAIHLAEIIAMLQVKLDSPSSALVERVSSFRLFPITTLGIESVLHLSGTKLHTLELGHECQLPRLTSAEHAELPHRFTLPHLARRIRQLSPNLTGLCLPMASYCNRYAEESTVLKALEALRKPGIPILGGTLQSIYLCLYSYAAAHENASGNHEAPISQDSCSPFAIALCLAYLAGPGCSIFIETRSWGSSCDCDKPRHIEAAVRFIHRLPASTLSILARISLDDIFQVEIEPVERDDLDHFPWRAPFPEAQWQQAVDRLIQKATRRAREPRRIKREAKEQAKTMMRAEKKNQKKEYRKAHKAEQAQKAKQG